MDGVEVPQFFICPISLQIMRDPVTVVSGITYDRDSIEQWLDSTSRTTVVHCPVTKQILPTHSDLTPNHTLRRLIQAWCTANASNGVDRIPTPKSPLNKIHVIKLLQDLCVPDLKFKALNTLQNLASEKESNKRCMVGAGAVSAMVSIIISCFNKDSTDCLAEALSVLSGLIIWVPVNEIKLLIMTENHDFFEAISWVISKNHRDKEVTSQAVSILKSIVEFASSNLLERLKPEFFESITRVVLKDPSQLLESTKAAALHILLETCPWGRNRIKIIEAGAVFHLIDLELIGSPDNKRRTTELIFGLLDQLCSCADGRAQFLSHAAGIAMVSKKILRVSPTVNDLAVRILSSICKFSGTGEVVQEMLRVGAVSKLCMILQAESAPNVKEKAREVLRLHSNVWRTSPCVATYLLTSYPS